MTRCYYQHNYWLHSPELQALWKFYVNTDPDYIFPSFLLAFVFLSEYQMTVDSVGFFLSTLAIIFGVLMAFQGLLNLLSVGEPNPFQGQEELTCQWNQPRHPNQRLTKNRNSVSNNLQRLLIHMKWRGYNSVKESVCSKIHLDFWWLGIFVEMLT